MRFCAIKVVYKKRIYVIRQFYYIFSRYLIYINKYMCKFAFTKNVVLRVLSIIDLILNLNVKL